MLTENDNLKDEVNSLKQALQTATSTIQELQNDPNTSQNQRNRNHFEALQKENERLNEELQDVTEAREEAIKQAFLQRQLTLFFKHREENADQALVDRLWECELKLKSKESKILEMGKSMQRMEEVMKQRAQPDKIIIDHYVLEPSMIVLQLQTKLDKYKKIEATAERKMKQL